jgi:hypothetical protein
LVALALSMVRKETSHPRSKMRIPRASLYKDLQRRAIELGSRSTAHAPDRRPAGWVQLEFDDNVSLRKSTVFQNNLSI